MSQAVLDKLKEKFGDEVILETHAHRGDETALVRADAILDVCAFLKDDPDCAFEMIMDVTGVDWPEEAPRLEVVYHLYSLSKKHRIRLKARVPEGRAVFWNRSRLPCRRSRRDEHLGYPQPFDLRTARSGPGVDGASLGVLQGPSGKGGFRRDG